MITPVVDDSHDIFGFTGTWVRKLRERIEKLYLITSFCNNSSFKDIEVFTLSNNSNNITKSFCFNKIVLDLFSKKCIDVVFCHMFPIYTILVSPLAKLFRVPIVTWYAHGHVSGRLKLAYFLANKMVTSSREGLRIKGKNKIVITGQGIDTNRFRPSRYSKKGTILSVGRVSPIKSYETLIKAADLLKKENKDLQFIIIGRTSDKEYYNFLRSMVYRLGLQNNVKFIGEVPYNKILHYYQNSDIFVSTSQTGSLDKTVLEAMACEKPVITCNQAYLAIFDKEDKEIREKCCFPPLSHQELAIRINHFIENEEPILRKKLREIVVNEHSVDRLIKRLVEVMEGVMG
jgi:glycosyltransferase involved in cell wall biosynthesis